MSWRKYTKTELSVKQMNRPNVAIKPSNSSPFVYIIVATYTVIGPKQLKYNIKLMFPEFYLFCNRSDSAGYTVVPK